MAYIPTNQEYYDVIYTGDARHRIRVIFNETELEDADRHCEIFTAKCRILPDDGSKRFSLDNFVATEAELILHDIDTSLIQDQVQILIGTLIDEENSIYEDVPIGIFNIQDNPETDKNKVTISLLDNASKFDFGYNAKPLIDANDGVATKMQILQDICDQANVVCNVDSFLGDSDEVGIYDSTITGRVYISYIAEQAGCIATINRDGELIFINVNNLTTKKIPLSIVEKYEIGDKYKIERIAYEDAIRKFETSDDQTLDTLYLNSGNPYISNQLQIDSMFTLLENFEIDSLSTGTVLGDLTIDKYDIIEVYGYYDENNQFVDDDTVIVARTIATYDLKYNGKVLFQYDTQIGKEERNENVSLIGDANFRKYAKTNLDNINNNIEIIIGEQNEQSDRITDVEFSIDNIKNLFQITGGSNNIKNSMGLLGDEEWEEQDGGEYEKGYDANLIGIVTSVAKRKLMNGKYTTKTTNITNLIIGTQYTFSYTISNDENTTANVKLTGNDVIYNKTWDAQENMTKETFSFVATTSNYILEISSATVVTEGYTTLYDIMLNSGDIKPWEPAFAEIYSTVIQLSQLGLQIYCTGSDIATLMTSQGFQIRRFENGNLYEIVTEFTKDGFISKKGVLEEIEIDDYDIKTITYQGYKTFILYKKES